LFRAKYWVINPLINSRFLYYALNSKLVQGQIDELLVGSGGQKTISLEDIRELLILKPKDPVEIEWFAKILYDLDIKIENLQNQNKVLEQITQAIFKSWFVDFDGQTEFVDSELGKIPKGWKVAKLSDFITLNKGISYKGKFLSDTGIPMVNLGNISKNGDFIYKKIKYYSGEFKIRHVITQGDIVIANTDITQDRLVLGSPAIVPPLNSKEIIFTHHIFAVRNNSILGNYFLYHLLQTPHYHSNVISYATGTTVLAISKEAILDFQFAFLHNDLINKFEEIVSYIYKLILNNNFEIQSLTKTREVLLPKLMSGEIKVKN